MKTTAVDAAANRTGIYQSVSLEESCPTEEVAFPDFPAVADEHFDGYGRQRRSRCELPPFGVTVGHTDGVLHCQKRVQYDQYERDILFVLLLII